MPSCFASAMRWMTAFVEPPIAIRTLIALLIASSVMMSRGRMFFASSSTTFAPDSSALRASMKCGAGVVAAPGRHIPSASVMHCIVFAVPSGPQAPQVGKQTL